MAVVQFWVGTCSVVVFDHPLILDEIQVAMSQMAPSEYY